MPPQVAPVRLLLLLLWFVLGVPGTAVAQPEPPPLDLATYPRTDLTITQLKPAAVHHLPESEGMIFPLEPPRVENMWMKNTYIELDMLFIDATGRVVKIIERAHPLSLETLSSGGPVSGVLELRGGLAAKLGLQAGDKVSWKKP